MTAKGFAPLLQFAYTAKLVLSRENIHEVIICADFLGVHNLEDSCFQFLQAQLQNDDHHVCSSKVEHDSDLMAEDTPFYEAKYLEDSQMSQQTNPVASTASPPPELHQYPQHRKYQNRICDMKHNDSDDVSLTKHTSVSQMSSQSVAPLPTLPPCRIKQEQLVFEEQPDERNSCHPNLCAEEVLEMELEVGGVPAPEHPPCRGTPSSCLHSYLQRGGLDLSDVPTTTIQQLLSNTLSLKHCREMVKDRPIGKNTERPGCKALSSKHEGDLDRCSVIFSTGGDQQVLAQSYKDQTLREKVSPLMQLEGPTPKKTSLPSPAPSEPPTQMSSSWYSFSHPNDPPSIISQSEFSSAPHPASTSGWDSCLAGVVDQRNPPDGEVVFCQGSSSFQREQCFGASGGNSSDESGSLSEADSESGFFRLSGPEVSISFITLSSGLTPSIAICSS